MSLEELAAEILKLSEPDRMKLLTLVEESADKVGIDLCHMCWSNGGTWCCQDEPKDW